MLANFAKVHLGGEKNMYRIAICDDDLVFGSLLEQYLQNFAKTRRIPIDVLVFARGEEYLEFLIEELPVDLIFLDIQFEKGLDGVQIGKELRADIKNEMTQIIYISGIESYAMQLFQNRPMDFLVKPVKQERVDHIMEEYLRLFGNRNKQYFDYNVGKTHYRLLEDEIIYFQCRGRKIQMFTKNEEEVEFYGQINEVKTQISEDKFWHIHKSYLVNKNYIAFFQASQMYLTNGVELPISRSYKEEVQKRLLNERPGKR